jgi:hypothetical protein
MLNYKLNRDFGKTKPKITIFSKLAMRPDYAARTRNDANGISNAR